MKIKGIPLRKRRVAGGLAGITAAAVVLGGAFAPTAAVALVDANVDDPSVAEAQILSLPAALLGDLELADLGNTITSFPSAPGPQDDGALDLTALETLRVDIGSLNVPLLSNGTNDGLLQLGDLGAMGSYSSSPSTVNSSASSGLIASGGGIDAGAIDNSTDPAALELTGLFEQLSVAGLTDAILDQASLSIGALASEAAEEAGTVDSSYRIAGLGLDLHSPAVAGLSGGLTAAINDIVAPVNGLVGDGGLVSDVLSTLSGVVNSFDLTILGIGVELDSDPTQSTAAVTGLDTLVNDIVADLLAEQISNGNGSVVVDLSTGTIHVDLAELAIGDNGLDPTDLENLNQLPENTEVLTPEVVSAITAGVTESLVGTGPDSLATKLQETLNARIWNEVGIEIELDASGQLCAIVCTTLADAGVSITGTLAEFAGKDGATLGRDNIDTTLELLGLLDAGALLDELAPLLIAPITSTVTGPLLDLITDDVLGNVRAVVQTGIVEGTLAPLLGVLSPVIDQLVSVTINEQPTALEPPVDGDLGANSFTVRALSVGLLPVLLSGEDAVRLELAEASIKALDALAPTLDALDPVAAGSSLPAEGTGWLPGSTVTLQLTDGAGANVGGPVTVPVAADGTFPAETVYAIPADAAAGTDYTLTASDADGNTDTDNVQVTAGDPGDVNTNAAASASASADATADGDPSAQAAAEAAALADATNAATAAANGDASIAAQAAATTDASTAASADSTTDVNAQASVAAQAAAQADASDDVAAAATALANANSSVAAQAAATADSGSSADASSEASTNANAAASASASANADATTDAVADVAAQAAAYADATAAATAAADSTAQAAASSAATATSSATATADATSAANANAAVAAQAAALADASSDTAAEGSAAVNGNASSAAEAAAIANSSADASVAATADADADADPAAAAEVNTNATASAAASAQADADNDAAAQAAAVAAALADASTAADAAATPDAEAAAASAATATATSAASADATTDANASAAVAAQAAAQADNSASTAADATAAAEADTAAAAAVAATATSSNDASATAAADADADPAATATTTADASTTATATATADADADPAAAAEVNTNATASASASAQADSDQNAAAQAAAVAAALADASTAADAAATADAEAAAAAAATADATADATVDATSAANAAAAVAAQASAQADNSASAAADTSAAADSNANAAAAASAASTANSSAAASANAAADASAAATADVAAAATATATASASASADADADPISRLSVSVKFAKLERGDTQVATGTGFAPGEVVSGTSGSASLGTQVASAEGTVTFTWAVPTNAELGTHTVTLTAPDSGSASASFQVVADGLAGTGSDVPFGWIALGVLLLMLGLGTALVARSRRVVAAAE